MVLPEESHFVERIVAPTVLLTLLGTQIGWAQRPATAKKQPPARETVVLETKDHVQLRCNYYAGRGDKNTAVVILLHGWEGPRGQGSAGDYDGLAKYLQRAGHAVLAPTLRGHPGSSRIGTLEGVSELDREKLRAADFLAMVQFDLEAVKKFLVQKHNAGQLNIELLCVVGADMGAVVAMNWAAYDWTWPNLPTLKQGQDVKALVLISPLQSFKGLPTRRALAHPAVRSEISALVIYGRNDAKIASEGRRLHATLRRFRGPVPTDPEEKQQVQSLYLTELDTSLQGTKMLASPGLEIPRLIEQFIQLRVVQKGDQYPWTPRPGS